DFFLSHRVYVASGQDRIYFTYNGGPVFDLRASASDARSQPAASPETASTTIDQAPALTAAELRRRGTASLARRDVETALVDLDKAVELDPQDPENLYQRGMARWANRQPAWAMSDFDATLKLAPEHVDALIARGTLRLHGSAPGEAATDFDRALMLAPNKPRVALRI